MMDKNSPNFQDAIARAKEIAQKLAAAAPSNHSINSSLKRPNADDDSFNKRPALASPNQTADVSSPVLRAQQIAQKINSQLGVKPSNDLVPLPLSNQLQIQEDYHIPDKYVGLVIGKGGEQIIRIQAESGCKVIISPFRADPVPGGPDPPDRIANLCGSKDSIERARRIIDDIVARGRAAAEGGSYGLGAYSMGGGGVKTIDVWLPSAKCGLVIGKGGENIKRVSEEFNVKLFVATDIMDIDGIEHKPLKITGEADKIERAKQYVIDSLSKSGGAPLPSRAATSTSAYGDYGSQSGSAPNGTCNEVIYHAPHDKAGVIIGKGGESIKEINRKSGAYVELDKNYIPPVDNSSDRIFKLRGTPEQIALAQQLMYEKISSSPGGAGDMLTPVQFQQQYNLPAVGPTSVDPWNPTTDPYATDPNDPYSQWASVYSQWSQMNPYANGTSTGSSSTSTDAAGMDPTWLAYYQQMSYYSMMQANAASTSSTAATTTTTTTTTAAADPATSSNGSSTTGQVDYSKQWIEYYRSLGQNEYADQLEQQIKASGSATTASTSNAANPWAAYAQQIASNGTDTTANGTSSSTS